MNAPPGCPESCGIVSFRERNKHGCYLDYTVAHSSDEDERTHYRSDGSIWLIARYRRELIGYRLPDEPCYLSEAAHGYVIQADGFPHFPNCCHYGENLLD